MEAAAAAPWPESRTVGTTAIRVREWGLADYRATWKAMQAFTDARTAGGTAASAPGNSFRRGEIAGNSLIGGSVGIAGTSEASAIADEIWLCEHPPVYTLGLAGRREHLRGGNAIEVIATDRGGQVTFHGPGQAVAYLLIDLRRRRSGVREFVRVIEAGVIQLLDYYGVHAWGRIDAPGVYVAVPGGEAKIAALGLKIRNGCSYHGVALNVRMDLAPFRDIDPCGFPGLAVTELAAFGVAEPVRTVALRLAGALAGALESGPHRP